MQWNNVEYWKKMQQIIFNWYGNDKNLKEFLEYHKLTPTENKVQWFIVVATTISKYCTLTTKNLIIMSWCHRTRYKWSRESSIKNFNSQRFQKKSISDYLPVRYFMVAAHSTTCILAIEQDEKEVRHTIAYLLHWGYNIDDLYHISLLLCNANTSGERVQ